MTGYPLRSQSKEKGKNKKKKKIPGCCVPTSTENCKEFRNLQFHSDGAWSEKRQRRIERELNMGS